MPGSMGVTISIRDQQGARAAAEQSLELDVPAALTLRDLIRTRVREEVAKANAAAAVGASFRTLVQPVDAEVTLNGYRLRTGRTIDWERQADKAEEAFMRNGRSEDLRKPLFELGLAVQVMLCQVRSRDRAAARGLALLSR